MRLALIETGGRNWILVWSFHHLLLDGWCMPLVMQEVFSFYEAAQSGREVRLPGPALIATTSPGCNSRTSAVPKIIGARCSVVLPSPHLCRARTPRLGTLPFSASTLCVWMPG